MSTAVHDARPPAALVGSLNPIMRALLRTPVGRLVKPLALIDFQGRRSGRRYRVPVGWHEVDGAAIVFSPASWRVNFAGGAPATVHRRGHKGRMTGTLVTDPSEVATALQSVLAGGTSPRALGLDIPTGHTVTARDVMSVGRAMIRFRDPDT
jgi:hypothetical protein